MLQHSCHCTCNVKSCSRRWTRWPSRSPVSNLCDLKVLCYYPSRNTAFSDSICKMTPQVFYSLFPPLLNSCFFFFFPQLKQWDLDDNIWHQRVGKVVEWMFKQEWMFACWGKNNTKKLEKRWKDRQCAPVSFSASKWDFDVDTRHHTPPRKAVLGAENLCINLPFDKPKEKQTKVLIPHQLITVLRL